MNRLDMFSSDPAFVQQCWKSQWDTPEVHRALSESIRKYFADRALAEQMTPEEAYDFGKYGTVPERLR